MLGAHCQRVCDLLKIVCQLGDSPLYWAIRENASDIAQVLLDSGADVGSCDNVG